MYFAKSQRYWDEEYPSYWSDVCRGTTRREDGPSGGTDFSPFLDFAKLEKGQHVLDACCGFGRMIPPLLAASVQVSGFDISQTYVNEVLAAFGDHPGVREIFHAGADNLNRSESYDRILCFSAFDVLEQKAALTHFTNALVPGGALVFHAKHAHYASNDLQALTAEEKSIENSFPIHFIDLDILLQGLHDNGLVAEEILYFERRGDLAKWHYQTGRPSHFYEFAMRVVKRQSISNMAWPDFSLEVSQPYVAKHGTEGYKKVDPCKTTP